MKLLKRIFKIKRYFFIHYTAIRKDNHAIDGNISITNNSGRMFNQEEVIEKMIESMNLKSFVISNIIELSRTDYKDLYKSYTNEVIGNDD